MFGLKKKKTIKISSKDKKRVLVVEDDALLAGILMKSILTANFEALNVADGSNVMGTVKTYKPHIILLDLILPGLDGFEVLKQLKADEVSKKIPVFVLSNLSGISDVKSAKVLGAEEYFIKARSEMEKIVKAIKDKLEK